MFDLNEEDLERAAREMRKAAKKIQERMLLNEYMKRATQDLQERPPYDPFVSTARMATSITRRPFMPIAPLWAVITSPYIVEKQRRGREKKRTFWQRVWASLTDLNQWPYSPIEYYEVDVPAIMVDRANNQIICHPSLEREIKNAVSEGKL